MATPIDFRPYTEPDRINRIDFDVQCTFGNGLKFLSNIHKRQTGSHLVVGRDPGQPTA